MRPATRRKLRFAAAFAVYFTALWALWDTPLVYPLKVFVVLLHELSHAAVAVATGGSIERIVLDPAQGGACYCPDGNAFLTLSAGYLGSLAWGGVLLTAAQSRRLDARWVTALVGAAVVVLTALYVRNAFGLAFGLAFGGALLLAARRLPGHVNQVLVTVLGLTSCLYAILDIKSDILDRPHLRSDAAMLAELTNIHTVVWGVVWIAVAVLASLWLLQRAWEKA